MQYNGGCLCGAVRFSFKGEVLWAGYCHCLSCRKATGSPTTAFVCVKLDDLTFKGAAVKSYQSSPGVTRSFCGQCGTPITYHTHERADEVDLYLATLDDAHAIKPAAHFHAHDALPWHLLDESLPKE